MSPDRRREAPGRTGLVATHEKMRPLRREGWSGAHFGRISIQTRPHLADGGPGTRFFTLPARPDGRAPPTGSRRRRSGRPGCLSRRRRRLPPGGCSRCPMSSSWAEATRAWWSVEATRAWWWVEGSRAWSRVEAPPRSWPARAAVSLWSWAGSQPRRSLCRWRCGAWPPRGASCGERDAAASWKSSWRRGPLRRPSSLAGASWMVMTRRRMPLSRVRRAQRPPTAQASASSAPRVRGRCPG